MAAAGLIIWQGAWMAIFALASPLTTKVSITEPVGCDVAIVQNVQLSPVKLREKRKRAAQAMLPSFFALALLDAGSAPDCSVALAAVHWSPVSGLERYLGVFPARGADSRIHFSLPLIAVAIPATALLFPGCSAVRTTLGLVGEALGSEELLLGSAKGETCAAVYALEGLVYIGHG